MDFLKSTNLDSLPLEVDHTATSFEALNLNEPKSGFITKPLSEDAFNEILVCGHKHNKFIEFNENGHDDDEDDEEENDDDDDYDDDEEVGVVFITNLADIAEQFAGLKRKLRATPAEEWDSVPEDDNYLYSRNKKRNKMSFETFFPAIIDLTTTVDEVTAAALSLIADWVSESVLGLTAVEPDKCLPELERLKITPSPSDA